jgi:DnaJ-class molecular chaperone
MDQDGLVRCPECRGSGKVLLLFSWAKCQTCDGTGKIGQDDMDTDKFPVVPPSGGSERPDQ